LCKDLGADEVIDYGNNDVSSVLASVIKPYSMVLDNVGSNFDLYWRSATFTALGAKYVQIGAQPSLSFAYDLAFRFAVPTWLGGGQRPFSFGFASTDLDDFTSLAQLVAQGKVMPVIDEVFAFDDVPQAYRKLKGGHAKGKIVVQVHSRQKN
jgi:NADPH:quinone reductase-like Zn-dependent oxidoreductase